MKHSNGRSIYVIQLLNHKGKDMLNIYEIIALVILVVGLAVTARGSISIKNTRRTSTAHGELD